MPIRVFFYSLERKYSQAEYLLMSTRITSIKSQNKLRTNSTSIEQMAISV